MITASRYPRLETALLMLRWDGFLSARQITRLLERWTISAVREELGRQAADGRLWRMTEILRIGSSISRFARPRHDAGALTIERDAPRRTERDNR